MNDKKKKLLNRIIIPAIALVALAIYLFANFQQADVLKIENGRVKGATSTWLIGTTNEDGEKTYVKLGDMGTPADFTEDREAEDPDGDPITTFFVFVGKDAENHPERITVTPVVGSLGEMPGEEYQWKETDKKGNERVISGRLAQDGDNGQAFYMASPYGDACIEVRVTGEGNQDPDVLTDLLHTSAAKVTPGKQVSKLEADIRLNFVDDNRWTYLTNGLLVTLEITLVATILGVIIGVLVAAVRFTWDQNSPNMRDNAGKFFFGLGNGVCKLYLTIIRGTPMVIQLLIMYYLIFTSTDNGVLIAMIAFGINSGAYVAEIIRGGIMSVDRGQMEAGRSLGFGYLQTMRHIIIPQALKNVLPALANEFIVLLKETSVAGYVAVKDLAKGGDIIQGVTYSPFLPLIAVALIYLILVVFFTWLVGKLERRLRASDH